VAKNENGEKKRTKITASKYEPQRAKGGFGPPFPHQISTKTPRKFRVI
jgi:hypothetical protein